MKEGYCPFCEEYTAQRFSGNLQLLKMQPMKEEHQADEARPPFFTCLDEIWWCPNCGKASFFAGAMFCPRSRRGEATKQASGPDQSSKNFVFRGVLLDDSAKQFLKRSEENMKAWKKEVETYKAPDAASFE